MGVISFSDPPESLALPTSSTKLNNIGVMKVLLGDDHQLFLEGTSAILKSFIVDVEIDIVFNGTDAYEMILTNHYDAALLDLRMPGVNGFDVLAKLQKSPSITPIIILSASDNPADGQRAMDLGARAFISKKCSAKAILSTLEQVLSGKIVVAVNHKQTLSSENVNDWANQHGITPRQLEVLRLLRLGLPNQSISERLSISIATVKTHVAALFVTFDAKTRSEVVDKAQMLGLD